MGDEDWVRGLIHPHRSKYCLPAYKTDLVFYYRTRSGFEVDFAYGPDSEITLVQVSAVTNNEEKENREKRSLFEAMDELNLYESTIVTLDTEKEISENGKTIHVMPAWKYLLFS